MPMGTPTPSPQPSPRGQPHSTLCPRIHLVCTFHRSRTSQHLPFLSGFLHHVPCFQGCPRCTPLLPIQTPLSNLPAKGCLGCPASGFHAHQWTASELRATRCSALRRNMPGLSPPRAEGKWPQCGAQVSTRRNLLALFLLCGSRLLPGQRPLSSPHLSTWAQSPHPPPSRGHKPGQDPQGRGDQLRTPQAGLQEEAQKLPLGPRLSVGGGTRRGQVLGWNLTPPPKPQFLCL